MSGGEVSKPDTKGAKLLLIMIGLGFVFGILSGYLVNVTAPTAVATQLADWFKALGDIFVRLIRIIIPLLIFFTIAAATSSIASGRTLGKLLVLILVIYIGTSALAVLWGILAGQMFMPGISVGLQAPKDYKPPSPPTGIDVLLSFFQTDFNLLLAVGGSMTMIIFAIILGVSTVLLGEEGRKVSNYLSLASKITISFVRVVMYYAPIAVFSYAAWLMIRYGPAMLGAYAKFILAQYSFSIFHLIVIYAIIVMLGGLNPMKYFKAQATPFMIAFTTRSSAVTLPYNIEAAKKIGISDEVYGITLPLGATVNMDGTALYQALSAMFIAQLFGITLTPFHISLLILAAVIGSVATAAIPGGGTIMLAYVLSVVGLPLEGIGIMLVVDPITDAMRTAINVSGDNASTVLISKLAGYKLRQS
ncbi:MAG: dicarboxylate/amino acid:cation symporter [Sulfolobales archaeon]|nr:dicarboxylate/amino acid:cation symporter [Sulfolobales archaeon]